MIKKIKLIYDLIIEKIKHFFKEKDFILFLLLFIIQLVSGATTVLGAREVLPKSLAWTIGFTIQILLFLLLIGSTAKHAPIRKWIAVIILTFFSIYSSFFIYYKTLSQDNYTQEANYQAIAAHSKLVSAVYSPLQDKYDNLKSQAEEEREKARVEDEIGINTNRPGKGVEYKKFIKEAIKLEQEAKKIQLILTRIEPLFDYETSELKPEEILEKDQKAWSSVPSTLRNDYSSPKKEDYITEETKVELSTGINRIKEGDRYAIASILLAITVDGMALMLGTAISINSKNKRKRRSIIKYLEENISNLIIDIKSAKNRLRDSFSKPLERDNYQTITLVLDGKCSEFIQCFVDSIEPQSPHLIRYEESFKKHKNETFRRGHRRLINKLQQLRWIQNNSDNNWEVAQEHYNRLIKWFSDEVERNMQEENEWLPFIKNNHLEEGQNNRVQVRIPLY